MAVNSPVTGPEPKKTKRVKKAKGKKGQPKKVREKGPNSGKTIYKANSWVFELNGRSVTSTPTRIPLSYIPVELYNRLIDVATKKGGYERGEDGINLQQFLLDTLDKVK